MEGEPERNVIVVVPYGILRLRNLLASCADVSRTSSASYSRWTKAFLASCARASRTVVGQKSHLGYFKTYFGALGTQTIVLERQYTDRDYLDDYAAYYVRCLAKYPSRCCRLHFFSRSFKRSTFMEVVRGRKPVSALGTYHGFIVVKPLPQTVIGRTCLKTYPGTGGRHYPVKREYTANIMGLRFAVRSLAFQEQDRAAAACATSALWSAFQATGMLFHHLIESPVDITRSATAYFPGQRRVFPNDGLDAGQMGVAIKRVGLEPELAKVNTRLAMQATAYAYLHAGIPPLMLAALFDISDPRHPLPYGDEDTGHAVAITGYRLGYARCTPYPGTGTLFRSSRINRLYVHDDQIGPFARMTFDSPALHLCHLGLRDIDFTMSSSWKGWCGKAGTVCFAPAILILPLYPKVRIGLDPILREVLSCDWVVQAIRRLALGAGETDRLEWDVFLTTTNDAKSEWRNSAIVRQRPRYLRELLENPLPRFVWRCKALHARSPVLELLFDATDVEQGNYLSDLIVYHQPTVRSLEAVVCAGGLDRFGSDLVRMVPGLKDTPRWLEAFRR